MLKTKSAPPAASLAERIEAIHAEIDALIEAKAVELKKTYGDGVFSLDVLKHDIRIKALSCPCEQYRIMTREG
jgi:hypothetical protein